MKYDFDWKQIPGFNEHNFAAFYERAVLEAPPNSTIVEIGCFHGRSLVQLGLAAKAANKGLNIVGFDCCSNQSEGLADEVYKWIAKAGLDNTKFFKMRSVEAAKLFEDESIWMCFIDAGHTPPEVAEDIDAWTPKVRNDGIIAGHDFDWDIVANTVILKLDNVVIDPCWSTVWWAKKQVPRSNDRIDLDGKVDLSPWLVDEWRSKSELKRSDGMPAGYILNP